MTVSSVRLTKEEKAFLERLVSEGKYASVSEALKAGVYELMKEERLRDIVWKTCDDVRSHFSRREKNLRGLEEQHEEDD